MDPCMTSTRYLLGFFSDDEALLARVRTGNVQAFQAQAAIEEGSIPDNGGEI